MPLLVRRRRRARPLGALFRIGQELEPEVSHRLAIDQDRAADRYEFVTAAPHGGQRANGDPTSKHLPGVVRHLVTPNLRRLVAQKSPRITSPWARVLRLWRVISGMFWL